MLTVACRQKQSERIDKYSDIVIGCPRRVRACVYASLWLRAYLAVGGEVHCAIAKNSSVELDLLKGLRMHDVRDVALDVEEHVLGSVDDHTLNAVTGVVSDRVHLTRGHVLQLNMERCGTTTHHRGLKGQHRHLLTVVLNEHASLGGEMQNGLIDAT